MQITAIHFSWAWVFCCKADRKLLSNIRWNQPSGKWRRKCKWFLMGILLHKWFQFSDKCAYNLLYCIQCAKQFKSPIVQFGRMDPLEPQLKGRHLSILLETHWTNSQQVYLHISPVIITPSHASGNPGVLMNDASACIHKLQSLDGPNASGADLAQTAFTNTMYGLV